jgi:hypothetical protein
MAREGIRDWAQPYTNMEARACLLRTYNPQLVPGILQTRAYARALTLTSQPGLSREDLERQVEGRYSRRRLLEGPEPLALWSILDESVLARRFGDDPAIMREQLDDLLIMAQRPNIRLQVLPFEAGHHGVMDGSLILLSFCDGPDMAYLEGAGDAGQLVESTRTVTRYAMAYSDLQIRSLPPAASLDLIRTTTEERYPCPPPLRTEP